MAKKFDYSLDYKNLDLRENPELYTVGKGEQGVLSVKPYKSEKHYENLYHTLSTLLKKFPLLIS